MNWLFFSNLIPIGCDTQRSDVLQFKETSQWFCIKWGTSWKVEA